MNDFIAHILSRHSSNAPVIMPRLPGRFEQEITSAPELADEVFQSTPTADDRNVRLTAATFNGDVDPPGSHAARVPSDPDPPAARDALPEPGPRHLEAPTGIDLPATASFPAQGQAPPQVPTPVWIANAGGAPEPVQPDVAHDRRLFDSAREAAPVQERLSTFPDAVRTDAAPEPTGETPFVSGDAAEAPAVRDVRTEIGLFSKRDEAQPPLAAGTAPQPEMGLAQLPELPPFEPAKPSIRVSIGQIHIRTGGQPAAPAPRPADTASRRPAMTLDDYLKKRG